MLISDIELSRKLERTEGRANADFVETHSALQPDEHFEWTSVGGALAMYDGAGSPLTQTFGLGIFGSTTAEHLDELENFFTSRGAPVFHEVSPMADQALLGLLAERGYAPIELTAVMCQELDPGGKQRESRNPEMTTRLISENEADEWARVAAEGWATEQPALFEFILSMGRITTRTKGGHPFLAELDGRPVAAAGFGIYDDVCILAGAATVPWARNKGAQNALLAARLNYAEQQGCRLAMMCALPGGQSQKNAQRNGFEIAYTRIKWHLRSVPNS